MFVDSLDDLNEEVLNFWHNLKFIYDKFEIFKKRWLDSKRLKVMNIFWT